MDYAGIPGGAKWDDVLTGALTKCEALLVLIGPDWLTCTRSDGTRRLDVPDDWVRNEVATALERDIKVVPVLFGGTAVPRPADLPENLQPLCRRQCMEVTDARWNFDVGKLVVELAKEIAPVEGDDVTAADTGIRLLKDLIDRVPAVSDAVSRSKEVIENTHRQVDKLQVFKTVHDALHTIEFECLRPMRAMGAHPRLRPFKIKFAAAMRRIQDCIETHDMNAALRDDIQDQLALAEAAMQKAVDDPSETSFAELMGELDMLVSGLPPRLNDGIADAASELDIDRLLELMDRVREKLPPDSAEDGIELEPFFHGINALGRLRDELARRTSEHAHLQSLDSKLRTVCVGVGGPGTVPSEWIRVKRVRSRLAPPYSPPLEAAEEDLAAIESEIEAAVTENDQQSALDLLEEYFRSVSSVFRDVDTGLKEFCLRLSKVSQPLDTILKIC